MSLSPDLPPFSVISSISSVAIPPSVQTQPTPRKAPQVYEALNTWSSPIFIKEKRLPDIFPLKSDLSAFHDEDEEWSSGPPPKKLKFGRKSDQWHFVRRSTSPQADLEFPDTPNSTERPRVFDFGSPVAVQDAPETQATNAEGDLPTFRDIGTKVQGESLGKIDRGSVPQQYVPQQDPGLFGSDAMPQSSPVQPADQEPVTPRVQSFVQDNLMTGTVDSLPDSYPVLNTFSQLPAGSVTTPITLISEQSGDVKDAMRYQEDLLSTKQSQSLELSQSQSLEINSLPATQRIPSGTPEPSLEINIQDSTPLIQPLSLDSIPITPRLQPLPSPGLDLVSPIDRRNSVQFGGYFARSEGTEVRLTSHSQTSNAIDVIKSVQKLEASTTETHDPDDSEGQSVNKRQTTGDTFFNRLLARYDEGTNLNSETVNQPVSSPIPLNDSWKDDHADAQSVLASAIHKSALPIDLTLEAIASKGTSHAQRGLRSDLKEEQDSETADKSEYTPRFRESNDGSEGTSDNDDTISGKWRDATYNPSEELSIRSETGAGSPLLNQYPELVQSGDHSDVQEELPEASNRALNIDAIPQGNEAIPDTYFAEDSHIDRTPSVKAKDENDIEVVDLLGSDSSSISGIPADQHTPEFDNYEDDVLTELEADGLSISRAASLTPHDEMSKSNQETNSIRSTLEIDLHDSHPTETQHQEFYTAPVKIDDFDEENITNLTQHTNDTVEEHNADLIELRDPSPTILETPQKQESLNLKASPDTTRNTRSSQRITRSQSQQIAEANTSDDEMLLEQGKPTPADEDGQVDSTDVAPQGFRTANDYYSTLARLSDFYNNLISLLAVVVASSKPTRSTTGPRDFTQSVYLAAPNSQANNDFTIAQFFRPYSSALPYPLATGSIILLKNFKVQSYKRKMSLLSSSTSAWAVFDQASAANQSEMKVSIAGPPVDFGGAERGIAWGLGKWWTSLNHNTQNKITSAANTAKNQAEAGLEKKAASARKLRKTKSSQPQAHLQTPTRRQTRSSQSQSQDQTSVPNTPSTHAGSPSPTHRRTRSSRHTATTTPAKAHHNLRSGLVYSDNEASQIDELSEPNETNLAADGGSSQGNVKTRAQSKRGAVGSKKPLWHELRDGAVYKD